IDPLTQRQGVAIDLRAADDHQLIVVRRAQPVARGVESFFQRANDVTALGAEIRSTAEDDVEPLIERFADHLMGVTAHEDWFVQRELAEALEVARQMPRKTGISADQ